jgi:hypothetical protein
MPNWLRRRAVCDDKLARRRVPEAFKTPCSLDS